MGIQLIEKISQINEEEKELYQGENSLSKSTFNDNEESQLILK